MTITLEFTPEMLERARKLAEQQETDISAFLFQIIAEYLEEQEDLTDARERLQELKEGRTHSRPWAEVRAELLARAQE